jgi:hypothetical protein
MTARRRFEDEPARFDDLPDRPSGAPCSTGLRDRGRLQDVARPGLLDQHARVLCRQEPLRDQAPRCLLGGPHEAAGRARAEGPAIDELREIHCSIGAGVPAPLPGVTDEACFLGPYGRYGTWIFYFARRHYACSVGSAPEPAARELLGIDIASIDRS